MLQRINQIDRAEEPNFLAMVFNRLSAKGCPYVSLSRARTADQNDIVGVFDELAPVKLPHQCFVDFARGKIKTTQILVGREARRLAGL